MMVFLLFVTILLALAAAAFCAGAETSFLSVSRERVLHLAEAGGRKARIVQAALDDLARTTATLLIGNNLASVIYSASTSALIAECCADSVFRAWWSFFAAFVVLYFSEFLPKLLCAARPLRWSLTLSMTYSAVSCLLKPLARGAMFITDVFLRGKDGPKYRVTSRDLIRILQDRKNGVCLSNVESVLVGRIISLRLSNRPVTADSILSVFR